MNRIRRVLLLTLLLAAPVAGQTAAEMARKKALDRPRRVIFNNDGGEPARSMRSPSEKEFLDLRTTQLAGTHVDSIFYCSRTSGFGVFTHFSKIGQVFTSTEGNYEHNQMAGLLKAGLDPLTMQCNFGKKHNIEVFWSLRMNDTHDGSKAEYGPIMFKDNKLKNEHPEYLLGTIKKPLKHGAWSAVNYGLPEVRELCFRYIEEVCRNYDIDGIELDFFRHPVFFKSTARGEPATQEELDAMTELIKRIRTMTEEVAAKRGKPILVAVKSPDSVDYCKAIGLDLEAWMKSGLFDMYIPGGYFQLNEWDYSIALARKYGLKVFPSLDESRLKDVDAKAVRNAAASYRGRAAAVWNANADGVYFFNFNDTQPGVGLLNAAGDPKVLLKHDRDYFASVRGVNTASGGNLPYAKYQLIETLNPVNPKVLKAGTAIISRIHLGERADDATPRTVTVRVQLKNAPKQLQARWNGEVIPLKNAGGEWWESTLELAAVKPGFNQMELTLTEATAKPVQWADLTVQVRPKP
ncbi:hypothetical protein BH11PLA2_BH11PLA2_40880 [soil metagenome]